MPLTLSEFHDPACLDKLLPWERRGLCFVFSSPSGGGKTSLVRRLLKHNPTLALSVSATTRPMRAGEEDGKDYCFLTEAEFAKREAEGYFLEHAEVFGNRYGTPRSQVEGLNDAGRSVLFDIDWQGGRQLRAALGKQVVSVFILPPSFAELEARLHSRAREEEAVINKRLQGALDEIKRHNEYDYVLVNHTLEETAAYANAIITAELLRAERFEGIEAFASRLRRD